MSSTITFTGNESILTANFFPEICLDRNGEYSCALLDFTAYNSIPNITAKNNRVHFSYQLPDHEEIARRRKEGGSYSVDTLNDSGLDYIDVVSLSNDEDDDDDDGDADGTIKPRTLAYELIIPPGAYELKNILEYIKKAFALLGIKFDAAINEFTQRVMLHSCSVNLHFNREDSIHRLLGFDDTIIPAKTSKEAENIVNITTLNTIVIECDLIDGSYINGDKFHTLHQFANQTTHGYKIVEVPHSVVYLPIKNNRIQSIQIRIADQDGNLIDFCGEKISCRIHIKRN